ncbi:YhbD family protein [Candidatus Bipolaricaulota bacterium]|nr:YhbD family protein [Candidatus Bipolaricaulota bacterium]
MEDDNLISKKEVLEEMAISYGQLYRWKRKGLIPEAWFVRRSTFTGQETFFPRDQILERVRRIKDMKSEHALDDLAGLISEQVNAKLQVAFSKLQKLGWLDEGLLDVCHIGREADVVLSMEDTFCLGVLRRLRQSARDEELDLVRRTLADALKHKLLDRIAGGPAHLHLLRKRVSGGAVSAEVSMVVISPEGALFDPEIEEIAVVDLGAALQRIKLDLAAANGNGDASSAPSEGNHD